MAIPRSRKKLTYVLNNVDTRVRHLEMRPKGSYANVGAIQAIVDNSIIDLIDGTISNIGPNAPSSYKSVIQARYIPYNLRGGVDRIEIYTDVSSGAVANGKMSIYGLHGANLAPGLEASGSYTVIDVGEVFDHATQALTTAPSGTYVFSYSPGYKIWSPYEFDLSSNNGISKYSATTTTGTLTISDSETNHFLVGDVIYVNGITSDFNGPQILTEVTSTTISFNFRTSLANPITETNAPNGAKATAAIHEYVNIGDTWIDTSVTPNVVYVWNGSAWTNLASSTITADSVNPSPPTDVNATAEGIYDSAGIAKAKITVTWIAPTTNADGTPLKDLAGYVIYYRQAENQEYYQQTGGPETTQLIVPLFDTKTEFDLYIAVKTRDSGGNLSEFSTVKVLHVNRPVTPLIAPSAPVLTSRLGTVTVTWDGKNFMGGSNPDSLDHIEVHRSPTSNFSIDMDTTYIGSISSGAGGYVVASNLTYNTTYYFKFISVDKTGVKTAPSAQQSIAVTPLVNTDIIGKIIDGAKIVSGSITASDAIIGNTITGNLIRANAIEAGNINANSITSDKISVGALDGKVITGSVVQTAKPVGEGGSNNRIVLNQYGLYAYNTSGTETFKILANTGAVTIGAGATNPDLTGVSTTANNAYGTANTAYGTANTAYGAANTAYGAANTISSNIYTPGTTTIEGGKVTATSSINFASSDPALGTPARSVKIGDHVVPGYNGQVTITGLSFYRSGTRYGIMGTSAWADMAYGADELSNALSYTGLGSGLYDTYIRSSGAIIISGSGVTSVYGGLSSAAYASFFSGVGVYGSSTFNAGEIAVLSYNGNSAGFRIFTNNPAAFGIWADETYRFSSTSTAAKTAALLHADTGTMTLRTKNVVVTSTRTSKDDIADYPMDLRILDLNPVTFRYKNPGGQKLDIQLGLIAEEVDDLGIDLLVLRDEEDNPTAIDYMKIPVLLTPIIKDLRARVIELESRLNQ